MLHFMDDSKLTAKMFVFGFMEL